MEKANKQGLAIGLGTATAGGLMGMATTNWKYKQQLKQAEKLQGLQMQGQKQMGEYNQGLALDMWNKTGYGAQRNQMENAGLNAGLMYGMGGGGGVTAATPTGNVSGQGAETPNIGMGAQLGLAAANQMADVKLKTAQAKNIEADTSNKPKEGAQIEANTAKTAQETKNAKVIEATLEAEQKLTKIKAHIADVTQPDAIKMIAAEADRLDGVAKQEMGKGRLMEQEYNEYRKQLKQDTIKQAAEIIALKEGTEFNNGTEADILRWIGAATKAVDAIVPF